MSTQVLEAVLIVSIMISAVAFVATFDAPPTGAGGAREGLETRAQDALAILHDTPISSPFGTNELSAFIAECLNQRCENLSTRLERLVPPGASYAIYVSNGVDTYPVIVEGVPSGEAVTATQPFEPQWSSTFVEPATDSLAPEDAMLVYALPVFHSNAVAPGGSQLLVRVNGTRTMDGSDYVLVGSYATIAQASSDPAATAASLSFVDAVGQPMAVHDLPTGAGSANEILLRLEETQGAAAIPAGAEVSVHVPRGFTAVAQPAKNPGWNILASATDANGTLVGSAVRANLTAPLISGQQLLVLDVTYAGDVLDYYPFVATMSKGVTATAGILVGAERHENEPAQATPLLQLSVPSPMGKGAPTNWTLSAYIPVGDDVPPGSLAGHIEIHNVEISEKEGNAIFDCDAPLPAVTALSADGGTWECEGDKIRWTGKASLDRDELLNLSFTVRASGVAGPTDMRSQHTPPIASNDWTGRLLERSGWGFTRGVILPEAGDYEGYEAAIGDGHVLRSNSTYRNTLLPGSARYNVSAVAAVQDSLFGSFVTAEDRNVPVGGEVVINANVQSVLYTLADLGQRAGVTLRFYPPWSGDERIPIYEESNLDQGLLSGEVTQMVVLDVNGDGFPDPIVGTTNGRVLAFHGLTGLRLQGNSFTAPLSPQTNLSGSTEVTAMETIRYAGNDYVVVGFDSSAAANVVVLHKNLTRAWEAPNRNTVSALDTQVDTDGDGERDVVVVESYQQGMTNRAKVLGYRLGDPDGRLTTIPTGQAGNVLADVLGTPTSVAAQARSGPHGATTGVLVPVQTLFEPGVKMNLGAQPPVPTFGSSSMPRAGVVAANRWGEETSTLFGAPVSVIRSYDDGGDAVDDAVFGGSSGYVILSNGTALTQPIYSYLAANGKLVDGEARSSAESYALTTDGTVIMTDDAWISSYYSYTQFPGAKAVSSNYTGHYWVVGPANGVWRTVEKPVSEPDPTREYHPEAYDFEPLPMIAATRANASYDLALKVHEFRDVSANLDTVHVVGTKCLLDCTEPALLRTVDGGATWNMMSFDDGSLVSAGGTPVTADLNRIEFIGGTGWIVGDGGTLLRSDTAGVSWHGVASGVTYDLLDIDCKPNDPDTCMVVGESGAAFRVTEARGAAPVWENLTGRWGLPSDRPLFSVGYVEDERVYVGSTNSVFASFWGANFTALPLNYVENDAHAVATAGDGSGFLYGGGAGNMRIWLLHDYATQSRAVTTSYESLFPADARIVTVTLVDSNVTVGQQEIRVNVTRGGGVWKPLGTLIDGPVDPRDALATPGFATFDPDTPGRDLRFNVSLNTTGSMTILSPHVRWLTFRVSYVANDTGGVPTTYEQDVKLDFATTTWRDASLTTADWNTSIAALRQPLVRESWTRNVSGQVYDIQTGFSVTGDVRDEVWVATGDILAENSPDHILYAGTNLSRVVGSDDKVYLLDGRNGNTTRVSAPLEGEVRQIRLVDHDGNDWPETLFAITWSGTEGRLYALNASTLVEEWNSSLLSQLPTDIEVGRTSTSASVFVGTKRDPAEPRGAGKLWGINASSRQPMWSVFPDDMGKYLVAAAIPGGWLFGPYVVEIEVEWEETVTSGAGVAESVLRSARFYDHFMVTPPGALSPPAPVYTAKLLVWMQDWR